MKQFFTLLFLLACLSISAQQKVFLLEGQVVDHLMKPVSDVYVVNLSSHEKDISNSNGVFSLWVTSSDSLIFSHISYYRKVVKVHYLLLNPVVMLEAEHVDIPEIRISAKDLSDQERAQKNLSFLQNYNPPTLQRMNTETDPVLDLAVENNELMRSEASSIHLVSFSPSEALNILYSKFKRKDPLTDYSSTRKVVEPPKKTEKEEDKEK